MAGALFAEVPPSVAAWEAKTVGTALALVLPPNDNQRLHYEALARGVTTDGRGAVRLVERMEDQW
jgi:hypothetical protein